MKKRKTINILSWLLNFAIIVSVFSCGGSDDDDDNDPEVDPLVGTYIFKSAEFAAGATVAVLNDPTDPTLGTSEVTFMVDDDAYAFVGGALIAKAPCTNPTSTQIQIREDNTTYYVCSGEMKEARMGSWMVSTDGLNFTLSIIDPAFDVIMPGFTLANDEISGTAIIPIPIDQSVVTGASLPGGGLNIQAIPMNIVFAKV
ncbi:MAG: hypothetical protein O2887_04915 [Bacteroidetes bacterium]|nr:hypothetical protein [Bacteroidota bacterium]MDA1119824.1 hypothetical protein [Bacteroidota bacterium]